MFGNAGDHVIAKKRVLLAAMIVNTTFFEGLYIDRAEVELDTLADFNRRFERQAINVAQGLCLDFEPVRIVTQSFERMYFDRLVIRYAVIARI